VTGFAIVATLVLGTETPSWAAISATPSPAPTMECNQYEGAAKDRCVQIELQLKQAQVNAWIAASQHDSDVYAQQVKTGQLQSARAPLILTIVVVIVALGLWLSVWQFAKSSKIHERPVKSPDDSSNPAVDDSTDLKISLQGLELKTATVGLAIFLISLAFLYLYWTTGCTGGCS
jgi:flagellar basal body-associated protein FliL